MAPAPRIGVVVFPGSNCDHDAQHAIKLAGAEPVILWHGERSVGDVAGIILPGGFSYGDYLRTGSVARFSPVMAAVKDFADAGGLVMGICNGFQVLAEAHLLPGALMRNTNLKFICEYRWLRAETANTPFTAGLEEGAVIHIPVAHHDGNYYASDEQLEELEKNDRVVFRYCDSEGNVTDETNPNGSRDNIAGICNERRNVLGMMPHPERAMECALGSDDGAPVIRSFIEHAAKGVATLV